MINATIKVNAVAPAWSLQDGINRYNDCYYILVTSPLLQDLLKSIGTTSPRLLAIGLQTTMSSPTTQAFPLEYFITIRMASTHIATSNYHLLR
jgi:hypothetical protein